LSDSQQLQQLIEIKAQHISMNDKLEDMKQCLATDRQFLWKLELLTIGGAFALIGIKLVLPS